MGLVWICFFAIISPPMVSNSLPRWHELKNNDMVSPSIKLWQPLKMTKRDTGSGKSFAVLSLHVYNSNEGTWYIPSRHEKYGAGWNRSMSYSNTRPDTCCVQFYGIALENDLEGYLNGGTGHLRFSYNRGGEKQLTGNYGSNSSLNYNCYYMSNQNHGSDFQVCFILIHSSSGNSFLNQII